MLNTQQPHDVIIIGGGLAGLTAAVYLARAGRQVTLLEKSTYLGGRATTQTREGFYFNLGPHALSSAGEGIKILAELGVPFTSGSPQIDQTLLAKAGALYPLPITPGKILKTPLLGGREKLALSRLMLHLTRVRPETAAHTTWQQWLDQQTDSPALQALLHTISRITTYINAPEQMSASLFLQIFQAALTKPVLYLDGGWQVLVDGLRQQAEAAGVNIETGVRVTAVRDADAGVTIRLDDGAALNASAVLLAVDPQTAASLFPNELLEEQAETAVPVRAATLDVALSSLPWPDNLLALGVDEPTYLSVHSAVAKLAPAGSALIQVARYLGPEENGSDFRSSLENLLDLMQPSWRQYLVHQRFLPNMVVANRLPLAAEGGLNGRPDVVFTDRIFLAGDWVGPTGWLAEASFNSARAAARRILAQPPQAEFAVHEPYSVSQ